MLCMVAFCQSVLLKRDDDDEFIIGIYIDLQKARLIMIFYCINYKIMV